MAKVETILLCLDSFIVFGKLCVAIDYASIELAFEHTYTKDREDEDDDEAQCDYIQDLLATIDYGAHGDS